MKRRVTSLLAITAMTVSCIFVGCGDTQEAMGSAEDELVADGLTEFGSLDSDVDIIVEDYLENGMNIKGVENSADGQAAEATPDEAETTLSYADVKLLKEQTRSTNKEALLEIINSEGLTDTQKQEAVAGMVEMTAIAEKEAAAEILLEAKGFKDIVVSINGDTVYVIVNATELDEATRTQIEDIVARKTEIPVENIIISTVVQ